MSSQRPTFETPDRQRIYEFIEERGEVDYGELTDAGLLTDPDRYRQLVAVMKRDGVLEEYRGRDVGSHLMQRALSWAGKAGFHKVYNSIPETNQSGIEFLEIHGWDTEAIRRDYYRIGGEFVDEIMMAKLL